MLHFLANVAFRYIFVALAQSVGGQGFCKQMLHFGKKYVCVSTNKKSNPSRTAFSSNSAFAHSALPARGRNGLDIR